MSIIHRRALNLFLIAAALLIIFWTGIVTPQALWAVFSRPVPAVAALIVLLAGAQLSIWRWHILLGLQGSPLAFGQVWRISYISWFLGSFLPGAARAGDPRGLD